MTNNRECVKAARQKRFLAGQSFLGSDCPTVPLGLGDVHTWNRIRLKVTWRFLCICIRRYVFGERVVVNNVYVVREFHLQVI